MIYLFHIGYQLILDILEYLTLSVPVYIGFFLFVHIFTYTFELPLQSFATPAKVIKNKLKMMYHLKS